MSVHNDGVKRILKRSGRKDRRGVKARNGEELKRLVNVFDVENQDIC